MRPLLRAAVLLCAAGLASGQVIEQVVTCVDNFEALARCASDEWYLSCIDRHRTDHDTRAQKEGICGCLQQPLGCMMSSSLCSTQQFCENTADALGCPRDWCTPHQRHAMVRFEVQYSFANSYSLAVFSQQFHAYLGYIPASWLTFMPDASGDVIVIVSIPADAAFNARHHSELAALLESFPSKSDMVALTGVSGRDSLTVYEGQFQAGSSAAPHLCLLAAAAVWAVLVV